MLAGRPPLSDKSFRRLGVLTAGGDDASSLPWAGAGAGAGAADLPPAWALAGAIYTAPAGWPRSAEERKTNSKRATDQGGWNETGATRSAHRTCDDTLSRAAYRDRALGLG